MIGLRSRASFAPAAGWVPFLLILLGALLGMGALSYLIVYAKYRFAIAVTISLLLVAFSVVNLRLSIIGTLVYLVFMGDLRRLLIPSVGWSGEDPLLLIGPVFALIVFAYAWSSNALKLDTPLAGWIAALMVIMVLQMFNPRQGGLIIGVAGALFYLVPLLWYWIGRTYATPGYLRQVLFSVLVPLGGLAAAFGLYQTFYGLLPYQQLWADIIASPYLLGSAGIEKPFSFFASPTEHDNFILSALAVLVATLIYRRQYSLLLLILPMMAAIFLGGSRGPVLKLLVTAAGLWAVIGTNKVTWIVRGLLALVIGVAGLSWGIASIDVGEANERVQYRFERQQQGIAETSAGGGSAANHVNMMFWGVIQGFQDPLGLGLGATTKAGAKYGGVFQSTETDAGDLFRSTGLVGGVIYLIILFLIVRSAFRYWQETRSLIALCLAGVLAINFLLWLMGGKYAVTAVIWFLIGALDRFQNMPDASGASSPERDEALPREQSTDGASAEARSAAPVSPLAAR